MSEIAMLDLPALDTNQQIEALVLQAGADDLTPTDVESRLQEIADIGKLSIKAVRQQFQEAIPSNGKDLQGEAFDIPDVEPWTTPVGPEVFDEVRAALHQHLHLSPEDASLATLWAAHSYCFEAFAFSPRLAINAPDKGCGKSILLNVLALLSNRSTSMVNLSTATLFRIISNWRPTLFVDEVDSWLVKDSDMTGILNIGVSLPAALPRCEGDGHEVRVYNVHGPIAMAGINLEKKLAAPTKDRCLWITMEKAMGHELSEANKFNRRHHEDKFRTLGRKLARWVQDNLEDIKECDTSITPSHLINREQDKWESMFVLAACVGGDWFQSMEKAELSQPDPTGDKAGVQMLADIRAILNLLDLNARDTGGIHTELLRDCLLHLDNGEIVEEPEENRWRDYNFTKKFDERFISNRQVNNILAQFLKGKKAVPVRLPENLSMSPVKHVRWDGVGQKLRGWYLKDLREATLRWEVPEKEEVC